jgi:hypothetical protein
MAADASKFYPADPTRPGFKSQFSPLSDPVDKSTAISYPQMEGQACHLVGAFDRVSGGS